MDFNVNKCGVMHIGKRNLDFQYQMNDGWVKSVDEERDLGVLMSKALKFSKQCLLAENKDNLILGIIIRGVLYKSAEVISKLCRGYVRPHLEYCIQFWSPINERCRYARRGTEKRNLNDSKKKIIIRGKIEKVGYVFSKA